MLIFVVPAVFSYNNHFQGLGISSLLKRCSIQAYVKEMTQYNVEEYDAFLRYAGFTRALLERG